MNIAPFPFMTGLTASFTPSAIANGPVLPGRTSFRTPPRRAGSESPEERVCPAAGRPEGPAHRPGCGSNGKEGNPRLLRAGHRPAGPGKQTRYPLPPQAAEQAGIRPRKITRASPVPSGERRVRRLKKRNAQNAWKRKEKKRPGSHPAQGEKRKGRNRAASER